LTVRPKKAAQEGLDGAGHDCDLEGQYSNPSEIDVAFNTAQRWS
jgi:hypothetical protein